MRKPRLKERKNWSQHSKLESATASVCALALAFLIRSSLHTYLDDGLPTLAFTIATIFIGNRYGYRWAMGTLVIGFIIATYFFVKPYGSFDLPSDVDLYRMIYYFGITTLIVAVMESINREKYESELKAKESNERYREMVALDKQIREQRFID